MYRWQVLVVVIMRRLVHDVVTILCCIRCVLYLEEYRATRLVRGIDVVGVRDVTASGDLCG